MDHPSPLDCIDNATQEPTSLPGQNLALITHYQRLPDICAICGEVSTERRQLVIRSFWEEIARLNTHDWKNGDVPILLPLCREHRSFRRGWPLTGKLWLISILPVTAILALLLRPLQQNGINLLVVAVVWLAIELVAVLWILSKVLKIRVQREDPFGVVLVGVSPKFARACTQFSRNQELDQDTEEFLSQLG